MGKSNGMDAQHETCDYVQMHIFRVPRIRSYKSANKAMR